MNLRRRGKSRAALRWPPRQSGGISCQASLRVFPAKWPVAMRQSSPVSQASPTGSGRLVFCGKSGARERTPQMRGEKIGSMRKGSGFMGCIECARARRKGNFRADGGRVSSKSGSRKLNGGFGAREKTFHAAEAFVNAVNRGGVGKTEISGSAEGFAGHQRDLYFLEQQARNLRAALAESLVRGAVGQVRGDIRESVERAAGPFASDAIDSTQALDDALAAPRVLGKHDRNGIHRASHGRESGVLGDGCGIRGGLALQLDQGLDERLGRERVADAPAGHGKRFGNRTDDNHAGLGTGDTSNRERLVRFINEVRVALIAHEPDVMLFANGENALVFLWRDDSARRIARRI